MINDSALSNNANEFVPCFSDSDIGVEPVPALNADEIASNHEAQLEPEAYPHADDIQHVESYGIEQHSQPLLDIGSTAQHADEFMPTTQQAELEIPMAQAIEPEPEPQPLNTGSIDDDKAAIAATAAVAVAAVAASAVIGVAKTASPKVKQTDAKKIDSKVKAAPIKRTTATTTVTSKVAAARTSASKTDDKPKAAAAAPKTASRTVASKISSTADKKSTVTSTVPRKPASSAGM